MLRLILLIVILSAVCFHEREMLPSPCSYTERLVWLNGTRASQFAGEGLDCDSFLLNARGISAPYGDFYSAHPKTVRIVATFPDIRSIDVSRLQPGDILATKYHVAAYLGQGVFIDADYRRGTVAEWKLDELGDDPWFASDIRQERYVR